jgi:hypothetical protein
MVPRPNTLKLWFLGLPADFPEFLLWRCLNSFTHLRAAHRPTAISLVPGTLNSAAVFSIAVASSAAFTV